MTSRDEAANPIDNQVEQFLAAVRDDKLDAATRLLETHADVGRLNIFSAAAAGRLDSVADFLKADPACALATHGQDEWPPLAYACRSPFHRVSARRAEEVRGVAIRLLEAGASPNSFSVWFESNERRAPISVLYHACMSDHPALVALLLERGAKPNDGESIYHAAQCNRQACLEVLLAHGADLSSRQAPYNNTPLYFLVGHHTDKDGTAEWFKGLVWLLDHGADPNETAYDAGETPLHGLAASYPKLATVRQLIAHGADVNRPRRDGRTPYAIAVRHGNEAIAELLRAHGARPDGLLPMDEFLGACLSAEGERVRRLLAEEPNLLASMTDADRSAMVDAVRQDRADAIRLMAAIGFDLRWEERDGGTPLHHAAWLGKLELVQLLVDLGAPVNLRDRQHGSSPVGWAAHGSGVWQGQDDRYCAILDTVLARGADRASSVNSSDEPPEALASPKVAAHLRAVGFAPPEA
jgi:ankyrin repeat protein